MGVKLYFGGFGDYQEFTVAEDEPDAIKKIGEKINAPFLPITVKEIYIIDGFCIQPVIIASGYSAVSETTEVHTELTAETTATVLRHCKQCDFTCENQGDLLRHYREKHPKGD